MLLARSARGWALHDEAKSVRKRLHMTSDEGQYVSYDQQQRKRQEKTTATQHLALTCASLELSLAPQQRPSKRKQMVGDDRKQGFVTRTCVWVWVCGEEGLQVREKDWKVVAQDFEASPKRVLPRVRIQIRDYSEVVVTKWERMWF